MVCTETGRPLGAGLLLIRAAASLSAAPKLERWAHVSVCENAPPAFGAPACAQGGEGGGELQMNQK